MAQRKDKLDWYQAQCDMFDADKIQKILIRFRREQHIEVFGTIHLMLAKVYGDKGYYTHWDVESQALFAAHHGSLTPEYVGEITAACCQQRMFSLNVYEKMDVLTSEAIICNYLGAVKKRTFRRDEPTPMISDYLPNTHAVRNGIIGAGNNLVLVDTNGVLVDLNLYLGVQVSPINVEEKRGDTEEVLDGKKGVLDGQNSALDLALSEEERATYKEFEQAHGMIIPDQDKQRRAVRDLWGWAEMITAVNGEAGLKPGPFQFLSYR